MSVKIEDFVPVVKHNGLNTSKNVDFSGSTTVLLPAGTTLGGSSLTALGVITSTSANALTAGRQGATNPAFNVDASAASQLDGLNITGLGAGSGSGVSVITSGTNSPLTIDAAGSGTITIGGVSTGRVILGGGTSHSPVGISSTSATAFVISPNGTTTTNPSFQVDASTGSAITGLKVTAAASGNGIALIALGGTNELVTLDGKGTGVVGINTLSTTSGLVTIGNTTSLAGAAVNGVLTIKGALTAGGLTTSGVQIATSGPLVYSGSGAPSISAAVKGSIYLRSDGTSTTTRAYVAIDSTGGWTYLTGGA